MRGGQPTLRPCKRVAALLPIRVRSSPHGVEINGEEGPHQCAAIYLLIDLVWNGKIDPGRVLDLALPLEQVDEGYRAMDEHRAIKTLLRPQLESRMVQAARSGVG
jgi:hypothetical protein